MAQLYFSLVFHNHQPVGNFDFVFQDAFEKAYKPLTDCLDRHPTIPVAMHFTGPLLDWLQVHHPEYVAQVAAQVKRNQLEILSGAYYEPILAMLKDSDKIGQIKKQNVAVQSLFGTKATGMWLAERIWEPHLSKPIHEAGIQYTIIDDTHFKAAGFHNDDLFGYFITEEQGYTLKIAPTHSKLRYLIPWRPVEEVIDWLREQADQRQQIGKPPVWTIMADDGEKFGLWPHTYKSIWGEGWLDNFFEALEQHADWLKTIHPGHYMSQFGARGPAYLPTASYQEMGEWALPSPESWLLRDLRESFELQLENIPEWDQNKREEIEHVLRFLSGSFWRNFLVKYPEINHMQKRGLALSKKIHALPPSQTRDQALDALWASQCNCGYWHGVFGGVYLFHIRSTNYTNIIKAENLIETRDSIWHETVDFNADSYPEVFAGNGVFTLVVEQLGGKVIELDYLPVQYNLLNIMSRHPEGYHIQIKEAAATNMLMVPGDDPKRFEGEPVRAKERGLEKHIYEDWHRRGMFVDHFLGEGTTLANFEAVKYPEQGDFVNQSYTANTTTHGDTLEIGLMRHGHVWVGREHVPIDIEKIIRLVQGESALSVHYRITNRGIIQLNSRFGVELALGFDGGDNEQYCFIEANGQKHGMGKTGEIRAIERYCAISKLRNFGVQYVLNKPATLWHFPLAPITLSEGGFERVHQGIVAMPWWDINLAPNDRWEFEIKLTIEPLE